MIVRRKKNKLFGKRKEERKITQKHKMIHNYKEYKTKTNNNNNDKK